MAFSVYLTKFESLLALEESGFLRCPTLLNMVI